MFKLFKKALLVTVLSGTIGILSTNTVSADKSYRDTTLTDVAQHPMNFNKSKQMVLQDKDKQHRATDSHIQLSYAEKPTAKRSPRLEYNPVGWHNYRFKYEKSNGKINKEWLFNRGHLVGYQFSGLNDESRNLVPETAYLNCGALKSMNIANKKSMLYYENHLASWLKKNKGYRLDYQVTPMYRNNELIPRQIRLAYIGYKDNGKKTIINLQSYREEKGNDDATVVYLDNDSPNAIINYTNGTAKNTLNKENTLKKEKENAERASSEAAVASEKSAHDASESSAHEASLANSLANEAATAASSAQEQSQSVVTPAADNSVNNTGGYKWAIQDGFDWQTRKGHSTRIASGGSLPAGYHWQVQ
ncbi:DNA/RNA non-specific endonuclease [Leuconostoc gasicomitatum]|uniref:DNA/RNA non-specific endonuclease n=1 Tax=Leuconostoc gasicomitatum TaxID=115778 RepID=UPI001CC3B342|nr:DNA/RNA non-specific endonuclease [Leuconostoc gasicomitatum]MBZ5946065.1 DNA/RNA non-specific endonuclease [Leuconostoc gasicomitatum]